MSLYFCWSGHVLVDRPTQLICISDIYLLSWRWRPLWSGGTLYQWSLRLKKASWVRFFFQNIRVIYKLSVKKQETGQKTGKKPPKKRCFYQLLWPAGRARPQKLPTFMAQLWWPGHQSWQLSWPGHKSWSDGLMQTPFFWRVFARFMSCFLLFHGQFVYEMPFLQKKSSHLTFSSRRSASYKVPPRIGGHHFLLCQQTNTKDIAGQSARASSPPHSGNARKKTFFFWEVFP